MSANTKVETGFTRLLVASTWLVLGLTGAACGSDVAKGTGASGGAPHWVNAGGSPLASGGTAAPSAGTGGAKGGASAGSGGTAGTPTTTGGSGPATGGSTSTGGAGLGGSGTGTGGKSGGTSPGTGGTPSSGGAAAGGASPGTGGSGPTTGGASPASGGTAAGGVDGGYYTNGPWAGYVWLGTAPGTGSNIAPTDFTAHTSGSPYCANGSVGPMSDFTGTAWIGWNVNQAQGSAVSGTWTPGSIASGGIQISVSNPGGSTLRLQIQGPNGGTDPSQRWCATITGTGGLIPWSSFNTACWNDSGTRYAGQPIAQAMLMVPGNDSAAVPFNFCLNSLGVQTGGGGTGGSGPGTGGAPATGGRATGGVAPTTGGAPGTGGNGTGGSGGVSVYDIQDAACLISSPTTWAKAVYLIHCEVEVESTLTIAPGSILKFDASVGALSVGSAGTLVARGTAAEPIYFTSYRDDAHGGDTNHDGAATAPAAGDWGVAAAEPRTDGHCFGHGLSRPDVYLAGGSSDLEYVVHLYGTGGIMIDPQSTAAVKILHGTFAYNSCAGLRNCHDRTTLQYNTFYQNSSDSDFYGDIDLWRCFPLGLYETMIPLDNSNVFHSGNLVNVRQCIDVSATVSAPVTVGVTEVGLTGDFDVAATLTLANGVIFKPRPAINMTLPPFQLEATGSLAPSTSYPVFTSFNDSTRGGDCVNQGAIPASGDWAGVYVYTADNEGWAEGYNILFAEHPTADDPVEPLH